MQDGSSTGACEKISIKLFSLVGNKHTTREKVLAAVKMSIFLLLLFRRLQVAIDKREREKRGEEKKTM